MKVKNSVLDVVYLHLKDMKRKTPVRLRLTNFTFIDLENQIRFAVCVSLYSKSNKKLPFCSIVLMIFW